MIKKLSLQLAWWPLCLAAYDNSYDLDFINTEFGVPNYNESWLKRGISSGIHSVDVAILNQQPLAMQLQFVDYQQDVVPCFSKEQLALLGVKTPAFDKTCYLLNELNADTSYRYVSSRSYVELFLPDISLVKPDERLKSHPRLWSNGIYSGKINYNSYASLDSDSNTNGYLGLIVGASIGAWRLEGSGSFFRSNDHSNNSLDDLYAYTDIDFLTSEFSVGQINTASNVTVNSALPITGFKLQMSDKMLNPKWQAYTPLIKGRVNSSFAKVTIVDEERVVFSKIFTTGEFEISDFDVSSVGTELKLIIEEADGATRIRKVPYARLPSMLKKGAFSYSLSAGKYRGNTIKSDDLLFSGQFQYGFSAFTSEVNALVANDYNYIELMNAFNLEGIGAFSFGVGLSNLDKELGHYLQVAYAKYLKSTRTSIHFAGAEYRSSKFETYIESIKPSVNQYQPKYTFEISVNQQVYDSSLYIGYRRNTYYQLHTPNQNSLYASLNTLWGTADVGLSLSKDDYIGTTIESEIRFGINVSIPLSKRENTRLTNYLSGRSSANFNNITSISQTQDNVDYSVAMLTNVNKNHTNNSLSGSVTNRSRYGDFGIRGEWNKERSKVNVSASGGVLAYKKGILFTPQLGNASTIVDFGSGAQDIVLNFDERTRSNAQGVAVIANALPYIENRLAINTTASNNVELKRVPAAYYPRNGGIMYIKADVDVGLRKLIRLSTPENLFGEAIFEYETGRQVSYVAVDNIIYLSGLDGETVQKFVVGNDKQCVFEVDGSKLNSELNEVVYAQCNH